SATNQSREDQIGSLMTICTGVGFVIPSATSVTNTPSAATGSAFASVSAWNPPNAGAASFQLAEGTAATRKGLSKRVGVSARNDSPASVSGIFSILLKKSGDLGAACFIGSPRYQCPSPNRTPSPLTANPGAGC